MNVPCESITVPGLCMLFPAEMVMIKAFPYWILNPKSCTQESLKSVNATAACVNLFLDFHMDK